MRLDFNVLWVEDQLAGVQSTRERIELAIKKEGFRLKVKFVSSIDDATKYLSDDIYGDHIDLVLMDYDLGAGGRGDDGLVEVRNIFQFKDIIFYSSQASDLPDLVANKRIQGVFCSTRDSLHETVHGVFDALMKKVLDIDHSRGIVMGATSDIDHYVNDCLSTCFDKSSDDDRNSTLKVVARHLKDKSKDFEKILVGLQAVTHVAELQPYHGTYTSNDRLRLLKNIFEKTGTHLDMVPSITRYLNETVKKRNDLAHVRVEIEGFSRKLFDRDGNELTSAQMKSLRHDLLEFHVLFEELYGALHSSDE